MKFYFFLLLFLFIYSPKLKFLEIPLGLVSIGLCSLELLRLKSYKLLKLSIIRWVMFCLFFALLALIVTVVNGIYDFSFSILLVQSIFANCIGSVLILSRVYRDVQKQDILYETLEIVSYCSLIQSVVAILAFMMPEFRDAIESILSSAGQNDIDGFRVSGLSAAGGAALSFFQAIGALSALFLISKNRTNLLIYLTFPLALIANTVIGRTGLICTVLYFLYFLVFEFKSMSKYMIKSIPLVLASILIIFFFFEERMEFFFETVSPWAFELFLSASEGGEVRTDSSDDLATMLHVPDEFLLLIFGTGSFDKSVLGVARSDSGYIKTILSIGLPATLIFYTLIFIQFSKINNRFKSLKAKHFFIPLFLSLAVFEIKEPFKYQNQTGRFISIMLYSSLFFLCKSSHPRLLRTSSFSEKINA